VRRDAYLDIVKRQFVVKVTLEGKEAPAARFYGPFALDDEAAARAA
jgi:hypothetical protein